MSKAILDLQKDCIDLSISCSQLLLKAYAIAFKLDIKDMVDFCNLELSGYVDVAREKCPSYREIQTRLIADSSYQCNIPISLSSFSEYSKVVLRQSIGEIETMNLAKGENLLADVPLEEAKEILKMCKQSGNLYIKRMIPSYLISNVLSRVRKAILEWTLNLERMGVNGENLEFSVEEKNKVKEVPPIQIIINGNVSNSNISSIMENSKAVVEEIK